MFTTLPRSCRRHVRRRGFTLVELLVVVAIITILSSLLLPAIFSAGESANLSACLMNLRQMGQAFTNYLKDFDFYMVSCGGYGVLERMRPGIPVPPPFFQPFREPPLDPIAATEVLKTRRFPFWYSSLAIYVNPAATWEQAVRSYLARNPGVNYDPNAGDLSEYHVELAKISGMYVCPSKKASTIGYGYNYAAPYGESILYPFDQNKYGLDYPSVDCDGTADDADKAPDEFCWPCAYTIDDATAPGGRRVVLAGYRPYPPYTGGTPAGLPILWYGQSAHFSVLTDPSAQIGVCDTGLVVNDPTLTWSTGFPPKLVPGPPVMPPKWREAMVGKSGECWRGFTRFQMNRFYTGEDVTFDDSTKVLYYYKYNYRYYDGTGKNPTLDLGWRPVPRHGSRTGCMYFDGRAMATNISDIVGYEWGDRRCLYDNRPPYKPPVPRDTVPGGETGVPTNPLHLGKESLAGSFAPESFWLPARLSNGQVDPASVAK